MAVIRVSIVGAGIGGLTAALALQRAGIKVDVYEQTPALGRGGCWSYDYTQCNSRFDRVGLG